MRTTATARLLATSALVATAPAAAQQVAVASAAPAHLTAAGGEVVATSAPAAPRLAAARPAMRLAAVTPPPDTVTMAELARGVPVSFRIADADGRALATPINWRVVQGDAAFTEVSGRSDADGFSQAVVGRAPWSLARPGLVRIEARVRRDGMARDSVAAMSFVLVRR